MSFLLFVGIVILAVLLFDMRCRLARIEDRVRDMEVEAHPAPITSTRARIVPEMIAPAAAVIEVAAGTPVEIEPQIEIEEATPPPVEPPFSEPVPQEFPAEASDPEPHRGWGFEELFGGKLPIWAGGVTLAVAGVLLVKYSIDAGLLSPSVRVLLGLLFGSLLIAGAEWALRNAGKVQDARVHQALAGAGVASLYAAVLAAANLYYLIGGGTAFAGLALVTALAMGLSVRFGAPSAVLGLVGGLAAPALVSAGPPNVPLLCAYLALAIGGLTALSRRQRWVWLGVASLVGGAGWSAILIVTGALDSASTLSIGVLVLLLGIAVPLFAFIGDRIGAIVRAAAAVVAAAQIATLVAKGGFAPLEWSLYLLLSAAFVWLAGRERSLRALPPIGLTVGLLLMAIWPAPALGHYTAVMLILGAIYVGAALVRLWRPVGSMIEAGQVAGLALAGYAVAFCQFYAFDDPQNTWFALLALAFATLPAIGAARGWTKPARREDLRFSCLTLGSTILVAVSGLIGLSVWTAPIVLAAVAVALLLLAGKAEDPWVQRTGVGFLTLAFVALIVTDPEFHELSRLFRDGGKIETVHAVLRWAAVVTAGACFARRHSQEVVCRVVQIGTALAVYGLAAQLIAPDWLAITVAAALAATAEASRRLTLRALWPTLYSFAALVILWALAPLATWAAQALLSLSGDPLLVGDLPEPADAARLLLAPGALGLLAIWRAGALLTRTEIRIATVSFAAISGVALHIFYKQIFHLSDPPGVTQYGLAERMVWDAMLLGTGYALWRGTKIGRAAILPVAASATHAIWYSIILFNPMIAETAVGPWPIFNLLIPVFAVPLAAFWLAEQILPEVPAWVRRALDGGRMIVILLFAYASLRQLFCGTLLVGTAIGETENIGWSVLAILLAIGFLLWGIRRGLHDWRIASLILMLAAVAKVFLLDASGLTGLLRIASFMALGFSLIGIGWLYSRFLRRSTH